MPAWGIIELDTSPPAITWRAVTVLGGALAVAYQWSGAPEAITATVTDPDGVTHVADVSEPGIVRYDLPGGTGAGVWSVSVYDDVLNPRTYANITLKAPAGIGGLSGEELGGRGGASEALDASGVPLLIVDMKATKGVGSP